MNTLYILFLSFPALTAWQIHKISSFLECHLKTEANKSSETAYNIRLCPGDPSEEEKHQDVPGCG